MEGPRPGAGSKISLCYDADPIFNGNEHWIEIDSVAAADGDGQFPGYTGGVAPGTYFIAGYMWDGHNSFTFSHLSQTITITPAPPQTFALNSSTSGTFWTGTA